MRVLISFLGRKPIVYIEKFIDGDEPDVKQVEFHQIS